LLHTFLKKDERLKMKDESIAQNGKAEWLFNMLCLFLFLFLIDGCNKKEEPAPEVEKPAAAAAIPPIPGLPVPGFNADRAFADMRSQVALGPRVPNSPAHEKAVHSIYSQLTACTENVQLQTFTSPGYGPGETLKLSNLIASFNPSATWRVLILTHFDSRPWADEDPDSLNHNKPIPAANDAGSGVGVMLELARQMKDHPPPIGVDLFFDDGEDYGKDNVDQLTKYFLGVKYFVSAKPTGYSPRFAILLDMVGDTNAAFIPEVNSMQAASMYVNEIWNTAKHLGLSHFHTDRQTDIEDDHLPLIQAGIPSVDIIDGDLVGHQSADPNRKYWHTLDDLPKHLSRETMSEVGRLLLTLIYQQLPQDVPNL
jgi:glutaminyl-peptide cyclotransferase